MKTVLSERLCDCAIVLFAVWTVCSHLVVNFGGVLDTLIQFFALAVAVLVVLALAATRRRRGRQLEGGLRPPQDELDSTVAEAQRDRSRWVGLALGVIGVLAYLWHRNPVLLWWWSMVVLVIGVASSVLVPLGVRRCAASDRKREAALWLLAILCVVVTLTSHRYDADDSVYVNLAVAAVDQPDWPLMSTDTLHDIEGLPIYMPAYRLHSYELLNGALARLTGLPAIVCFHLISASFAALLVPLALARFFKQVTPLNWLAATALTVVVLLAIGGVHRWHGNFALVRMWQGKSVFLALVLPLIYAYGVRFALRPTRWNWTLLFAAQIAAIGCTSSAVWSAPASAAITVALVLRPEWSSVRTLALGVLSSVYVVAAGLYLKSTVVQAVGFTSQVLNDTLGSNLGRALTEVFGDAGILGYALLSMTTAWALYPQGLARRFCTVLPFVVWFIFLNPYWDSVVIRNLVGPSYWRTLWALPLPILMAFVLAAPFASRTLRSKRAVAPLMSLGLVACLLLLVSPAHGLSRGNRVYLKSPELKVWRPTYDWAEALVKSVPAGAPVVLPDDIGQWVPTFHNHPYPLEVRQYLYVNRKHLTEKDYHVRRVMTRYVDGTASVPEAEQIFKWGLRDYGIEGVILANSPKIEEAKRVLRASGFALVRRDNKREMWLRSPLFDLEHLFEDGFEGGAASSAWSGVGSE